MASIIKADTLQSTTANVFVLNSSGTEYARFDASGNFQLANPTTFPAGTASLPSITATGDTNTGLYFPAADTIAFTNGGVERMRINSAGNTFIGVASAVWDERLGVRSVTDTGQVGLGIYSPSTTYASSLIRVQSENGTGTAYNLFEGRGQGGGVKIVIDGNGLVDLRNGQIKFPASQNASADANTLDDYEEGTWSPLPVSSGGTITAYTSGGTYTKIGRTVYLQFWTTIGTPGTASGTLIIRNLPFAPATLPSNPGNTVSSMLVREDAVGGLAYEGVARSTNELEIWTLTNGAVSWTTNVRYVASIFYNV